VNLGKWVLVRSDVPDLAEALSATKHELLHRARLAVTPSRGSADHGVKTAFVALPRAQNRAIAVGAAAAGSSAHPDAIVVATPTGSTAGTSLSRAARS